VESERFKQLPEMAKEKMQQMGTAIKNAKEQRNGQKTPQMRVQPNARGMLNQNVHVNFFNMLLMDDNLELMKEYMDSAALQNPAE